ncbi:D-sedoheptulose 7-phosphate isomerase [Psychrosphaera ytuae]|uniref:Phosphoheptose isomerase n=1 Tax=Psychrosphaera ytuae TaxID=2820710 RepID=A0A975HH91_9GAMM|nr:D-sedoheptulose 7-phosphate isomerase [Psychrosphaera ytuae]QTH62941.1 D-sedoheptulose 7-phosphate isomerase [Psychrosphaera ytuae]
MFNMQQSYQQNLKQHLELFQQMADYLPQAETLANECYKALQNGGKIVFFGNGGSAADSQHLAAEFVVRFKKERRALASIALTTDTSILTANANDYSFDSVFSRQVEALVKPEDVVIGLTTSGTSANINLALEAANEIGAYTVAFTGRDGGKVKEIAALPIIIKNEITARIQEAHMFIGHWLCEAIDELITQAD